MDMAHTYKPTKILLWRKVSCHPEALRIIEMFPHAQIEVIEHQRFIHAQDITMAQALISGKRTLMIGATQSFVGGFDGGLGDNVHCRPYFKLVPLSNGCPYYCTYCYLAFIYRKYAPYI